MSTTPPPSDGDSDQEPSDLQFPPSGSISFPSRMPGMPGSQMPMPGPSNVSGPPAALNRPFPAHWPKPGDKPPPPDFSDVVPYFNPPMWDGKASCLCRTLFDVPKAPVISFGRDLMNGIGMIMTRTACEEGFTIRTVEPIAIQNLAARKNRPEWQTDNVEWQGAARTIYFRTGNDVTASDVLDPAFLADMHATMDCRDVAMAIPTSTMMIVCPRDMALGLAPVAQQQYADMQSQGAEVLTTQLLSIVDGKLEGFIDLGEPTEDFPGSNTEES